MKKVLVILFLFVNSSVLAQLQITFPMSRAVFQRNSSGGGVIPVAGSFQSKLDRVDVRVLAINGGASTDWATININPNTGTFNGGISAWGGWYQLEVRGIKNQQIVTTAVLDKVGVGEVFVIAGQSNAMGYAGFGNPPATDDRVNVVTNYYSFGQIPEVPYPVIGHLDENTKIAPLGGSSWCWGRLGDLLTSKLGVPVLFFNTAMESMSVESWQVSADGGRGYDYYSGNYALPGYPYDNLRKSLYNYVNMFGARAVLWHQGETDSDKGTAFDVYRNTLQYLIQRSRTDSGKNLSWVVSKVSRTKDRPTSPTILSAQEAVIVNYSNVFRGPETDGITTRVDGVHFFGQGLIDLANAWNDKLNTDFFSRSTPVQASAQVNFSVNCNVQNTGAPLNISMQDGYTNYKWTNGSIDLNNNRNIAVGNGFLRGKATDALGNVYYTQGINYSGELIPGRPLIIPESATSFCDGGAVRLSTNVDEDFYWSTGVNTKSIVANSAGSFTVTKFNFLGCSAVSEATNITVFPNPEARIIAEGPTTFCQDKTVTLRSAVANGNLWSTGQNTPSITIGNSGDYTLKVKNEFGCETTSSKLTVTVNPKPAKPFLTASGPTVFCADASVTLTSDVREGIQWSTGASWYEIIVNQTGNYSVTATNTFGCQQVSEPVAVQVNPLPAKPTIFASGPTTFCEGSSVILTSSTSVNGYIWNNSAAAQTVNTSTSGVFSVKTRNENGCISPASDEVQVDVKPNAQAITVTKSGPYSLEALPTGTVDSQFEWVKDGIRLSDTGKIIKGRSSGNYTVRGSISYIVNTGASLKCYSPYSAPLYYVIDPADNGTIVFPNPVVDGLMNIETLKDYTNVNVTFFDMKGNNALAFYIGNLNTRQTLNLKNLAKGLYVVRIASKDYQIFKRVIVE
ncbi:sialate O-acetylesterase [Emticicia sp. 21SJ11W-3]|uniref:sialate O-acetylesterase n=1 Tax=Emticicia sp. 21SJ11W-3 TaxID=2916755 RepID=UPI0020A0EC86|nr:sialate O-acetylesterase [Emticicia sp. 21SJ11W-3]UTA66280.1 T9SS type A sorting domain-containing protein [Emticicia sp. 21SJ11W-3]